MLLFSSDQELLEYIKEVRNITTLGITNENIKERHINLDYALYTDVICYIIKIYLSHEYMILSYMFHVSDTYCSFCAFTWYT
jgi:vancomycin permeability regulator SanA